jgi:hypothetical protein
MLCMIPSVSQPDAPPAEAVGRMMPFNEALVQASALIALDGRPPRTRGARGACGGGKPTVTDGPFTKEEDVIGGDGMVQANSTAEAVAWARRCPASDGDVIEAREVFERSDLPPDV